MLQWHAVENLAVYMYMYNVFIRETKVEGKDVGLSIYFQKGFLYCRCRTKGFPWRSVREWEVGV